MCLNLVYVSPDASRSDSYGRQIERATSCSIWNTGGAHGNCWRYPHQTQPAEYGAALNGHVPEA